MLYRQVDTLFSYLYDESHFYPCTAIDIMHSFQRWVASNAQDAGKR